MTSTLFQPSSKNPSSEIRFETLAIGDELLTGRGADTNSKFVGGELFKLGMRLQRQVVVPDDFSAIEQSLNQASERADWVIGFGGLGPTSDDKTAECVSKILNCSLIEHLPSKEHLYQVYQARGREVTASALKQVLYPEIATVLPNGNGMAPGFLFKLNDCTCCFLPGVPSEMKHMFEREIGPRIQALTGQKTLHRTWRCIGIWESELQRLMSPIEKKLPPKTWLGYQTLPPENHLTLYFPESLKTNLNLLSLEREISGLLTTYCYSDSGKSLELLVWEGLKNRNWRVALAESCTGGLTAQRLSQIPFASDVLWGGYICYQWQAKNKMLGLGISSAHSAVSARTTLQLVDQAQKASGCEVSASITGYVGPNGGTSENPLGTLFLAVKSPNGQRETRITVSTRSRSEAQWAAASHLLKLILEVL